MAAWDLRAWMDERLVLVERALEGWVGVNLPGPSDVGLGEAMRYAVLDGGKRLRPLLVLAASEAVRGEAAAALRAACATELIHAYSLVHDDMPCMDNDVLRRGKPTVHVKYGEAQALLAGDALQALAFELLTPADDAAVPAVMQARLCHLLARAAGSSGMAVGQAIDLASVGLKLDEHQLRQMHSLKTGALLQGCVLMGAACGAATPAQQAALGEYGEAIGLAFQVVDDILDVTADSATLGKTAGKDAVQDKPTYVSLLGLARAQAHARELHAQALAALTRFQSLSPAQQGDQDETRALRALADFVVERAH